MSVTWQVHVDWDNDRDFSDTYDDISQDVQRIEWMNGISEPYRALGDDSTCQIIVVNADGKYNPENSSGVLYQNLKPFRQVRVQAVTSGGTIGLYRGWINSIEPVWQPAGSHTGKTTAIINCVGFKPILQATELNLELQENKRVDQIIDLALGNVVLPPAVFGGWILGIPNFSELGVTSIVGSTNDYSDLDTSELTIRYYGDIRDLMKDDFDPRRQKSQTAYRIIRDVVEAEGGRFYQDRAGKAVFNNRASCVDYTPVVGTIDSSGTYKPTAVSRQHGALLANKIAVGYYPRVSEGTVTLWSLAETITSAAGETRYIDARFRDANGRQCGGKSVAIGTVTASAGSAAVSLNYSRADRANIEINNLAGTVESVITGLTLTGTSISSNNQQTIIREVPESINEFGIRYVEFDLRALDNTDDAEERADHELFRRKEPTTDVISINFINPADETSNAHQLAWQLGDRVRVKLDEVGHDDNYWIIGESHSIEENGMIHNTTFYLEPARFQRLTYHNASNRDSVTELNGSAGKEKLAQSFRVDYAKQLHTARLMLSTAGYPSGTMTLTLNAHDDIQPWTLGSSYLGTDTYVSTDDGFGVPGTVLATAATVSESKLNPGFRYIDFDFGSPYLMGTATDYWLVLTTDRASSASNYVQWAKDSGAGYAAGRMKYYDGASWFAESADGIFEGVTFDS